MSKSDHKFLDRSDISEIGDKLRKHGKSGNKENRELFLDEVDKILIKGENLTHDLADSIILTLDNKLEDLKVK